MAEPAACANRVNNTHAKLLECVTLEGVREHQAAFQAIADANGGTRAAGTSGYNASVDYVAGLLDAVELLELLLGGFRLGRGRLAGLFPPDRQLPRRPVGSHPLPVPAIAPQEHRAAEEFSRSRAAHLAGRDDFQFIKHGIWDWDIPCAPILADVVIDGKPRKIVAQPTKQAWLYVTILTVGYMVSRSLAKSGSRAAGWPTWSEPP